MEKTEPEQTGEPAELAKLISVHETKLADLEKRIKLIEQEREGWFANQKKVDSPQRANKW